MSKRRAYQVRVARERFGNPERLAAKDTLAVTVCGKKEGKSVDGGASVEIICTYMRSVAI